MLKRTYEHKNIAIFWLHYILTHHWRLDLYSKTCENGHSQKDRKLDLQDQLLLNADHKYCRKLHGELENRKF